MKASLNHFSLPLCELDLPVWVGDQPYVDTHVPIPQVLHLVGLHQLQPSNNLTNALKTKHICAVLKSPSSYFKIWI